jgi:predicted XRE-type DNA-binding protein
MNVYLATRLMKDGKYKTVLIHRLVAMAFIENPFSKPNVNHIDFNVFNNYSNNLEWCTQYENIHHTMNFNRDRSPKGEENGQSKIKDQQIKEIFQLKSNGLTQYKIAEMFNVDQSAICRILNRKTYKHINL